MTSLNQASLERQAKAKIAEISRFGSTERNLRSAVLKICKKAEFAGLDATKITDEMISERRSALVTMCQCHRELEHRGETAILVKSSAVNAMIARLSALQNQPVQ